MKVKVVDTGMGTQAVKHHSCVRAGAGGEIGQTQLHTVQGQNLRLNELDLKMSFCQLHF